VSDYDNEKGDKKVRKLIVSLLMAIVGTLMVGGVSFAAGNGSVPLPPPNLTLPPGGGTSILQVQPLTPGVPLVATGSVDGLQYKVSVPALTFATSTDPLELVITSCSLQALGNAGFNGYTPYACIGVYVVDLVTGQALTGPYNPAVNVLLSGSAIQPPTSNLAAVYDFSSAKWVQTSGNTYGSFNTNETSPDYYILLAQNIVPTSTIPGATPQTGKPFLGEEIAGSVLVVAGLVGLGLFIWNRRRATRG
jgi:hypothetical protein